MTDEIADEVSNKKSNSNLHNAKTAKNDEFYTQLNDIERELQHYRDHFKGKVVLCNCDDPEWSNFWHYFKNNFEYLGLKKLISTHYSADEQTYKLEINKHGEVIKTKLEQNGDFRSPECLELLDEADIVVTNPPFSLFRDYISLLNEKNKRFLIVGSMNAITYKEIFPLIKDVKLWLGINNLKEFMQPDGTIKKFGNICWYTNLEHQKRNESVILFRNYYGNESDYPKYDNFDAIEVSKVANIPIDYDGVVGVPITFLNRFNPSQFEILRFRKGDDEKDLSINGKTPYFRILIKRKTNR